MPCDREGYKGEPALSKDLARAVSGLDSLSPPSFVTNPGGFWVSCDSTAASKEAESE